MINHFNGFICEKLIEHQAVFQQLQASFSQIESAANRILDTLNNGGKLLVFGNGGSAADAQHLAAELVGRFQKERVALPAIALTTDTSILTALANDYDYAMIFSRQVEALCNAKDCVLGISTSGNSKNVILGLQKAKALGAVTIGLTGAGGNRLAEISDVSIIVPSTTVARIQEAHLFIIHCICEWIEERFVSHANRDYLHSEENIEHYAK